MRFDPLGKGIRHRVIEAAIGSALLLVTASLAAQLSPGELSEAHAHLEGLSNCTKCHVLGQKVSNEKCLDCHTLITSRISAGKGYHASSEVKGKECAGCHNDHHGRNFQMIRFNTDDFDHALTGYELLGSHDRISCDKCHNGEHISDNRVKDRKNTFLGLDNRCVSCHADYHQGTLTGECATCHDFNRFRPAPGFDHDNARFRLSGSHARVECGSCHKVITRNGREMQQFTGIPFNNCTSCHRDVHDNRFGQDCASCHTEISFHQVKNKSGFDHRLTGFALLGKHASVACTACHKRGYSGTIRHNLCSDCHSDYHRNQFAIAGNKPDCSECHTVTGFTPSGYTIEKHNESPFILAGAHLATPCFDCHRKKETWEFRKIGKACVDCHENIHASAIKSSYYPEQNCTACHRDTRWADIAFDHSKTGYLLEGAHRLQSCRACHFRKDDKGLPVQQFEQLSTSCLECHMDAHHQQFEPSGTSCLKCHDYFDWKAGMFNHDQTAFPLQGKHRDVACIKCHPKVDDAGQFYTLYKLETTACESCH